jgi:hypothetical protein
MWTSCWMRELSLSFLLLSCLSGGVSKPIDSTGRRGRALAVAEPRLVSCRTK